MDGVKDIRPLHPVVPVRRRDEKAKDGAERRPARRPAAGPDEDGRDPDKPVIDEYV